MIKPRRRRSLTTTIQTPSPFTSRKSASSPLLALPQLPPPYTPYARMDSDDDEGPIYTSSIRHRKEIPKTICTTVGKQGAGETETETDEPSRRLPTARKISNSESSAQSIVSYLFEFCRLLAVVPALAGVAYNLLLFIYFPFTSTSRPTRTDHIVAILWAILTGHQSLGMTTGLLARWRLYYPPLATLVRLLALQLAICWPLVHLTCKILDVHARPEVVWAVIGTSTSISRSVQIWVTSNLWWEGGEGGKRWRGGTWGGRRWDWGEVTGKCAVPAGVLYFVMAWAEVVRREWQDR